MDVYCTAFTFPKALSGLHAIPPEGSQSTAAAGASGQSPSQARERTASNAGRSSTQSERNFDFLGGPAALEASVGDSRSHLDGNTPFAAAAAPALGSSASGLSKPAGSASAVSLADESSGAAATSSGPPDEKSGSKDAPTSPSNQHSADTAATATTPSRKGVGSSFSASMRSRFPPSVKAFMPSAFGGKHHQRSSAPTTERIEEGAAPDAEKKTASEAAAAPGAGKAPAGDASASAVSPVGAAAIATDEDERIDSSQAPPLLDKAPGGASSLRDASPPNSSSFLASFANSNNALPSATASNAAPAAYNPNRESRSTIGTTRSSLDQSSISGVSLFSASDAQPHYASGNAAQTNSAGNGNGNGSVNAGAASVNRSTSGTASSTGTSDRRWSSRTRHYSSEPTSVSHSAANSLSNAGGSLQGGKAADGGGHAHTASGSPSFSANAELAAAGQPGQSQPQQPQPNGMDDLVQGIAKQFMVKHQCHIAAHPAPDLGLRDAAPGANGSGGAYSGGSNLTPSASAAAGAGGIYPSSASNSSMPMLPFPTSSSQVSTPSLMPGSISSSSQHRHPSDATSFGGFFAGAGPGGGPYQHHHHQQQLHPAAGSVNSFRGGGPDAASLFGSSSTSSLAGGFPSQFGGQVMPGTPSLQQHQQASAAFSTALPGGPAYGGTGPGSVALSHDASQQQARAGNAQQQSSSSSPASSGSSPSSRYSFFLSGGYQQVMAARGSLLRDHPFKARVVVKVPRAELLESAAAEVAPDAATGNTAAGKSIEVLKPHARKRLDEIAGSTGAHLAILSNEARGAELGYGFETERTVDLVITGPMESTELARVRALVLLDELVSPQSCIHANSTSEVASGMNCRLTKLPFATQNGLHAEACELDYKLHNIIGGRKRCVIQTIQEETAASIYFPSSLSGVLGPSDNAGLAAQQNTVFITGDYFSVQRARDMLFQVSLHKSKCIISRDTAILPRKLDWMLMERMDELKTIITDNATFARFPPVGSQSSLITVFGDNRVAIERTIRAVMALASQYYVASVWLLPVGFDVFVSQQNLNLGDVAPALEQVSNASGAEVVFKSNCFEVHGLESEVRAAVAQLLELDLVRPFNFEVRFQIELAIEHRDFISGKKNGKINKIMKQCNVRIKFETFNEYNFLIDVSGSDRNSALQGLSFLQEELPAEISFHVPESHHKRIIGVGGKNIQRIMKKYGVYVKFSNAEEFASLGGYFDNEDNVVARTPAKNAINLEHLKQSVMEMISPKDKDYVTESLPIARRHHRMLLGEKAIFLHDIESKTNTVIRFPPRETASDLVSIFGPESQLHIAAQMLLEHVPFEAEFRIPPSSTLAVATASPDFSMLLDKIRHELNIHVVPVTVRGETGEGVFKLRLNRSNCDYLPAAKDLLEDFLISRNVSLSLRQSYAYAFSDSRRLSQVPVYGPSHDSRARTDSFASSLKHFGNKLISPAAAESVESFNEGLREQDRRLRAPASTPDVKALFDAPRPSMHGHSASHQLRSSALSNLPSHASPYMDRVPGFGSEVWGPPTQLPSQTPPMHANSPSIGSLGSVEFPHQPSFNGHDFGGHTRMHSGLSLQHQPRMSDSTNLWSAQSGEPSFEERMATLRRQPRAAGNRAHSLDIGALTAQQQAQAASALRQYNAQFMGGRPGQGPPHTHAAHPSISRLPPASAGSRMPDSLTAAEVSRVLSQLQLER